MNHSRLRGVFILSVLTLACVVLLPAQNTELGRIDFPTSGAAEAQPHFLQGALLLHSFEYEDAREAFQQARTLDPDFALAYWGEAMTYNHPLWREQDGEAARAALNRFAPTPEAREAKTPTEREKGYLHAVEVLYGEGDKLSRDLAYAEAMKKLSQRYPDDLEAASFYALSILGTAQGVRDFRTYMKAAAVVEEVFDENPLHPGAAHYLIHSYDDPIHAPLGLRAARVYAKIAPAATHAQHMISHIYVALGTWDEVATANEKSFAVSEERAQRKGLPIYRRNHHALSWLEYAYLQQGRYEDARRQLEIMEHDARLSGSPGSLWYFAQMRSTYVVQTQDGQVPESLDITGIALDAAAADLFATGLNALRAGDEAAAEQALAQLKARQHTARKTSDDEGTDTYAASTQTEFEIATILEKELEALLLSAAGKSQEAVRLMEEATASEESRPYEFGPPLVVKPSHELFGEMLLELGRPAEARTQFEKALTRTPRRALSLLGLARAATEMGDHSTAQEAYAELHEIWRNADEGLAETVEVRERLSQLQ